MFGSVQGGEEKERKGERRGGLVEINRKRERRGKEEDREEREEGRRK